MTVDVPDFWQWVDNLHDGEGGWKVKDGAPLGTEEKIEKYLDNISDDMKIKDTE